MTADSREILCDTVAPIPVGHRVEVVIYTRIREKLFGGEKADTGHHQPWLRDLDTGVEYGVSWHYTDVGGIRCIEGNSYPPGVRGDLVVQEKLIGKVLQCRVLTERVSDNWQVQTRLIVEPE